MANTYKTGWTDFGGQNLAKNTATGQVLPTDHPLYMQIQDTAPAPAPPPAGSVTAPGLQATPQAPQTAQQALTTPGTVGQAPAQGQPATVTGAFQQALLNSLAPAPVTASDPSIAPSIQANQLAQQRGSERQRAQNAERNAAQGLNNSGGAVTEQIGLEQDRAQQEGQFAADAITGQTDKNRQAQLMMAQLAGGMLQGQGSQDLSRYGIDTSAGLQKDAQGLQRYGIDQEAALRREGLGAQTSLGQGDLALRDKLGSGQLNLGLAGLLQGGQQFGQQLSSSNAQFGAGLNQQALLALLGGL